MASWFLWIWEPRAPAPLVAMLPPTQVDGRWSISRIRLSHRYLLLQTTRADLQLAKVPCAHILVQKFGVKNNRFQRCCTRIHPIFWFKLNPPKILRKKNSWCKKVSAVPSAWRWPSLFALWLLEGQHLGSWGCIGWWAGAAKDESFHVWIVWRFT